MNRTIVILVLVVLPLCVTNIVTYTLWTDLKDKNAADVASIEKAQAYNNAVKDARFAIQMGDYRLYEPVDLKEKLLPVRREGKFVVHSVNLGQFLDGTSEYWRWYFDMFNQKVRRDAEIADDPDQHVFKAIQSARQRGEWSGVAPPVLDENRWDIEETIRKKTQANP